MKTGLLILLKQAILTAFVGSIVTVSAFYLSAVLIVNQTIPQNLFIIFATTCICLGCFFSSVVLAWQHKEKGLLCGFICFLVYDAILWGAGWMQGVSFLSAIALLRFALLCASGCVGGYIGVGCAEKQMRKRRRI